MKENIYNLINTVWQLPAILVGIRTRVWEIRHNKRAQVIKDIWEALGLLKNYELTNKGKEIIKLESLIEYQIKMIPYQIEDDFNSKIKISNKEYKLLRKGLGEYFDLYLKNTFKELKYKDLKWNILDYGGGEGHYSKEFLKSNTESIALVIDRTLNFKETSNLKFLKVDFEKNQNWYNDYRGKYNLIILSELLHCKNRIWREYLIKSCYEMLKNGGHLLICEKKPTVYFQWRMDIFTNGGECISRKEILDLVINNNKLYKLKFEEVSTLNKGSHYLIKLKKGSN